MLAQALPAGLVALVLTAGFAQACHADGVAVYAGGYLDGATPVLLQLAFPPCDGVVPVRVAQAWLVGPGFEYEAVGRLTFLDGFHGCLPACGPAPAAAAFFLEIDTPAQPSHFAGVLGTADHVGARVLEGGFEGRPASLVLAHA